MKSLLLKIGFAATIISGTFLLNNLHPVSIQGALFPDGEESAGSAEDPAARFHAEQKKLIVPATGQVPLGARMLELEYARNLANTISAEARMAPNLSWTSRGPYHLGGRTRAVAIDATDENILIAGSVSGGMYRSTNGGTSWIKTSTSYPGATAVVQDKRPGHTNTWYYSSGEPYGTSASGSFAFYLGNGIYKSTDGGISWAPLPATTTTTPQTFDLPYELVWNIAFNNHDTTNTVILAACISGVYKSLDGGATFSNAVGSFANWSYFTDVAVTDSGVAYASLSSDGPNKGIYRSTDMVTWTNITPSFFPDTANRMKIGIDPSNQNRIYILGETPSAGQTSTNYKGTPEQNSLWRYDYISGNGDNTGGNWTDLSENIPHNQTQFDNFNSQGGYDLVVKVKPDDPNTVFICGTNIFRSTTGFTDSTHTTQIGGYGINTTYPDFDPYPNHHSDQHDLLFLPSNNNVMINAVDGGLYKTADCMSSNVTWSSLNNSYVTSQFYTVAVDHNTPGDKKIIGGAQDNGSWWENADNPTNAWTFSAKGDGSFCSIQQAGGMYYFSRQLGEIIKCTLDATGHATAFRRIDPIGASGYDFINPFVIDPNDDKIMYLPAGTKVWRNNDLNAIPLSNQYDSISTNWTTFPDTVTTMVSAIAVSKVPANRVYYGTSARKVYRVDNANTGSPTRTEITKTSGTNQFPGAGYVSCIAVDPTDADRVLVVFSNYSVQSLFYTSNGGAYWNKVGGNLEIGGGVGPSCRWASILPVSNGTVFLVATSTGMYGSISMDSTATVWVPIAENTIGNTVCDYIDTRPSDGLVVVATHGNGIWSTTITDIYTVGIKPSLDKISPLNLQLIPNPFVEQANIRFHLTEKSLAFARVYDIQGKEVKTLFNQELSAGDHQWTIERGDLKAGIYFCRIRAGSKEQTIKFVIVNP